MKRMTTILISILFCTLLSAPPNNAGMIFESEPVNPFESLWKATCKVESNFNPFAIGDKHLKEWSYGIAQIRRVRLDDYFKRTGIRYTTGDMFDTVKSKQVYLYYASQFSPHQTEAVSRAWNGGNNWQQKRQTKKYYLKIEKALLSL